MWFLFNFFFMFEISQKQNLPFKIARGNPDKEAYAPFSPIVSLQTFFLFPKEEMGLREGHFPPNRRLPRFHGNPHSEPKQRGYFRNHLHNSKLSIAPFISGSLATIVDARSAPPLYHSVLGANGPWGGRRTGWSA